MLHIKLRESQMQQHGRKYYPAPDPGIGVKCQNSTFSEHGHVAYQIKVN